MRFEGHFSYIIEIDKSVDPNVCKVPFLLIQPFVEKSINYGLVNTRSQGLISINVSRKKELLTYVISDNGVGRKNGVEKENNRWDQLINNPKRFQHEGKGEIDE